MNSAAPTAKPIPKAPLTAGRPDALRRHLPNALTVLRLAIAVVFFFLLSAWNGAHHNASATLATGPAHPDLSLVLAGVLFIIAALTDAVDGHLSRRWNVTTGFGRVMDPFADKVLVVGAFIFLASPVFRATLPTTGEPFQISGVAPWMVVLIMSRELLVTSIRGLVEGNGGNFSASLSGKLKMIVQSITIPTVILAIAILDVSPGSLGAKLITAAVWATVLVTVVSGWPYVVRGIAALRDPEISG